MKKFLIPILLLLLIASCKTREQRARKLIERADKLYPIRKMVDTVYKLDTLIKIDTIVVIKSDTVKLTVPIKDKDGKTIMYNKTVLKETDNYKITGTTLSNGDLDLSVYIKEKKVHLAFDKPFKHTIVAKKELITITKEVKVRGLFWWVGLITTIGIAGGLIFLSIRTAKRLKLF